MCRSERIRCAVFAALCGAGLAQAAGAPDYRLGRAATAQEIAGWDIDVRPDGAGLPPGSGSVADGEKVYEAHCSACHGTFGDSNEYIALAGGVGSLKTDAPVRTVGSKLNAATTLFDYINRAMPFPHSKSLTPGEVYAVTAYVLNLNDIVPADFVADRASLPAVKMPNRDGYEPFPGLSKVDGKPDTHNRACMHDCEKSVAVTGSLPPNFVAGMYGSLDDNFRGLATMNEQAPPAGALPATTAAGPAAPALIQKYGCVACHSADRKIVGPAFRDVAAKFKGHADAVATLTRAVRGGSTGVWGSVPMPPQAGPTDAELAGIIEWILAGAPDK
ncbi:MAG: c-type cytochrome [Proteobacteria bacterium]|nr:c-type cytochrome [Pseudomonadota bacterium]